MTREEAVRALETGIAVAEEKNCGGLSADGNR